VGHVRFDRVERHHQVAGDALVGPARGEQRQHRQFAAGQRLGQARRRHGAWPQARTSAAHCPAERFSNSTSTASDIEQAVSAWPPVMIGSGSHSPT
jgi:hypothetical protein